MEYVLHGIIVGVAALILTLIARGFNGIMIWMFSGHQPNIQDGNLNNYLVTVKLLECEKANNTENFIVFCEGPYGVNNLLNKHFDENIKWSIDKIIEVAPGDGKIKWRLNIDIKDGWRLPTKIELDDLYGFKNELKFSKGYYWSSDEVEGQEDTHAWLRTFEDRPMKNYTFIPGFKGRENLFRAVNDISLSKLNEPLEVS